MLLGKGKLIPLLAILILLIGTVASVYVYATQQLEGDTITIDDKVFTVEQLFQISEQKELVDLGYNGIALDDMILKAGVSSPENHEYIIVGSDGYQKTVKWENMKNGLLTKNRESIFSDLPKSFRVKNIIKIEVS